MPESRDRGEGASTWTRFGDDRATGFNRRKMKAERKATPMLDLVRLSKTSIADEMRIEHTRRVLGSPL